MSEYLCFMPDGSTSGERTTGVLLPFHVVGVYAHTNVTGSWFKRVKWVAIPGEHREHWIVVNDSEVPAEYKLKALLVS